MRFTCRTLVLCGLTLVVVALPHAVAAQRAVGVSPGAVDEMPTVDGRCSTFSWTETAGTGFYELVVYELIERLREP